MDDCDAKIGLERVNREEHAPSLAEHSTHSHLLSQGCTPVPLGTSLTRVSPTPMPLLPLESDLGMSSLPTRRVTTVTIFGRRL